MFGRTKQLGRVNLVSYRVLHAGDQIRSGEHVPPGEVVVAFQDQSGEVLVRATPAVVVRIVTRVLIDLVRRYPQRHTVQGLAERLSSEGVVELVPVDRPGLPATERR